jgi:hypothetical protein
MVLRSVGFKGSPLGCRRDWKNLVLAAAEPGKYHYLAVNHPKPAAPLAHVVARKKLRPPARAARR